ncbi:cuticle protein 16.8-like [Rhipicephalus sanguineus]|uniref:cuticle protein 16.8-like n=1 Tax=Rhipicephalus sanguineus TaxID=34632 RepID=UPI0020C4825F|nr:cuticle protein 16.8-like [Rhipicephalus sanguineus]
MMATAALLTRVDCGYLGGGGYGGGGYGGGGYGGGGYGKLWQPYKFGYQVLDGYGTQHREEKSNGLGGVKGSYGYTDAWGRFRQVHYVADKYGFRAKVLTNEPGTSNQHPAAVRMISSGGGGHG